MKTITSPCCRVSVRSPVATRAARRGGVVGAPLTCTLGSGGTTLNNALGFKKASNYGGKMCSKFLKKDLKTWAKLRYKLGSFYISGVKKGWLYVSPSERMETLKSVPVSQLVSGASGISHLPAHLVEGPSLPELSVPPAFASSPSGPAVHHWGDSAGLEMPEDPVLSLEMCALGILVLFF